MKQTITAAQTEAIFAKIRSRRWRAHVQAKSWVGHAIADVLGLDVREADGEHGKPQVWLGERLPDELCQLARFLLRLGQRRSHD
jgi:hypothetical protein